MMDCFLLYSKYLIELVVLKKGLTELLFFVDEMLNLIELLDNTAYPILC